jgi:hypothetical protein
LLNLSGQRTIRASVPEMEGRKVTTQQRTYLHTDGDDGADPLTKLLSTAPNCSILPREPQIHWPTARLTLAILTALAVIGWLIWRMM